MTEHVIPCAGLQYNHPDGLCQDTVLPPSRTARTFDAIAQLGFDVSFRSLPPPGNTIHNFLREHITPLGLEVITCFSAAESLQLQWTQQCVPTSPLSVEPSDVPTLPLCTHPVLPIDLDPQEPTPAFDNGLCRSSPLGASDRRDRGFGETPKSMSQPSHARVPLSLANHLPPPSLAPAVDIGCDDNDITDLFLSWESTEPPSLVSLTPPAVVTPLLSTTTSAHFENVELYTDGSRGPSDGPNHTTWAFVVLERTPNGLQLIDWYGDFISLDPLEPSWIGATHDAIRDGEGSALMAGGLRHKRPWWSQRLSFRMRTLFYKQRMADMVSATLIHFWFAWEPCIPPPANRTSRRACSYYFARQGPLRQPWQWACRFCVAVQIRLQHLQPRPLPRSFAAWMQGCTPKILRAGFVLDLTLRPSSLPQLWINYHLESSLSAFTSTHMDRRGLVNLQKDLPPLVFCSSAPLTWALSKERGRSRFSGSSWSLERLWLLDYKKHVLLILQAMTARTSGSLANPTEAMVALNCGSQRPFRSHGGTNKAYTSTANVSKYFFLRPNSSLSRLWLGPCLCFVVLDTPLTKDMPQVTSLIGGWPSALIYKNFGGGATWFFSWTPMPVLPIVIRIPEMSISRNKILPATSFSSFARRSTFSSPRPSRPFMLVPQLLGTVVRAQGDGHRNDYLVVDERLRSQWTRTWVDYTLWMRPEPGSITVLWSALGGWWTLRSQLSRRDHGLIDPRSLMPPSSMGWVFQWLALYPVGGWRYHAHADSQWHDFSGTCKVFSAWASIQAAIYFLGLDLGSSLSKDPCPPMVGTDWPVMWHLASSSRLWWLKRTWPPTQSAWRIGDGPIRMCARLRQHRAQARLLRGQVAADKARVAEHLLQPLSEAHGKQAIKLLKPLRLGKRHQSLGKKAIPMVRLLDGSIADTKQAATTRWRQHFGDLEGGRPVTADQLWERTTQHRPVECPAVEDLPTILELEAQLHRIQSGKAMGPDAIPGELKSCRWIAPHIMPLLMKVTWWIDEPVQWKGGRVATLFKHKGSPAECANHRAILISSTLGKTVHNIFRARAVPFARAGASQLQFSAHAGANVSLAAHVVRLHQS